MIPLDVDGIGSDFYGGNCHKWMLAPTGSGFLHFAPGAEERVQPLTVSWGWHYERSKGDVPDEFGSTPRLRGYEFEGVRDPCPWLAVPTAIDFQEGLGLERIRGRIAELAGHVRERFARLDEVSLATPSYPELHGAMTAFRLPPGTDGPALRRDLWERHRIEAPVVDRPEGLLLRVSTHFYNTVEEIDCLADALPALLGR
jgi:isopenicillin-N epimerase